MAEVTYITEHIYYRDINNYICKMQKSISAFYCALFVFRLLYLFQSISQ